jgi:hypothetical protein
MVNSEQTRSLSPVISVCVHLAELPLRRGTRKNTPLDIVNFDGDRFYA